MLDENKKNGFVGEASIYLLARIVNASIPFLLMPILTRYLAPSEYGEVGIFQVWVTLMGALCGLSVHGAAGRKYFDYVDPDKSMGEYIAACLVLLIVSSILLFLFIAPASGWLSGLIGLSRPWILLGVPFAFCSFLIQLRLGQWQVRKNPKTFGIFEISLSLVNMSLSLVFVVALSLGVTGRLSGYTIAVVLFGMLAAASLYRDGLIKMVWRPDLMREAAAFGIPLIPHIIGAFLLLTVDRAVIGARLGLEEAGYYVVAAQLAMVVNLILDSVNKAYIPWLFDKLKRDCPEEKRSVVRLTYGYYLCLLSGVAISFLVGKEFVLLIAGEKFAASGNLFAWLVFAQAIRGMYYMVCNYIFYAKKTGVIAKITITSGILNVCLLIVMTDLFGVTGAAWAMCISMLFQWLVTWRAASRLVSMPWLLGKRQ